MVDILNLGAHFLIQICKKFFDYKMCNVCYSIKSVICLSINDTVNTQSASALDILDFLKGL